MDWLIKYKVFCYISFFLLFVYFNFDTIAVTKGTSE